jgi:hypothetical protein
MRIEIIKGQLCMQAYFIWRNEMREWIQQSAKEVFDQIKKQKKTFNDEGL